MATRVFRFRDLPVGWEVDKTRAEDFMDWADNMDAELRRIERRSWVLAGLALAGGVSLISAASWLASLML